MLLQANSKVAGLRGRILSPIKTLVPDPTVANFWFSFKYAKALPWKIKELSLFIPLVESNKTHNFSSSLVVLLMANCRICSSESFASLILSGVSPSECDSYQTPIPTSKSNYPESN